MDYDEMLRGLAAAGHDVSKARETYMRTKAAAPAPSKSPRASEPIGPLVTLALDDVASVVDEAIAASLAPIEQRLSDLETRLQALEDKATPLPKEVVRVQALRRVV